MWRVTERDRGKCTVCASGCVFSNEVAEMSIPSSMGGSSHGSGGDEIVASCGAGYAAARDRGPTRGIDNAVRACVPTSEDKAKT